MSSNKVSDQPQDPNNAGWLLPKEEIDWLTQRTHYTTEEIQILYNGFLRDFPDGGILRSHFEIFFLNGKAGGQMATLVFK